MSKQELRIIIMDDRKARECDGGCGLDWSSAETAALAGERLREKFGDRARLIYLDLSEAEGSSELVPLRKKVSEGSLPLPLLVINGHPRISGHFDMRMLLDAVDAEVEIMPKRRGENGE